MQADIMIEIKNNIALKNKTLINNQGFNEAVKSIMDDLPIQHKPLVHYRHHENRT